MSFAVKNITIGGYKFALHGLSEDDPYFAGIGENAESEFYEICRGFVPEDSVCLDIGANIGLKTLFLSRHLSGGQVIAIEAAPKVGECLERNVAVNHARNVTVEHIAIGDRSGVTNFADTSAYGHISENGVEVAVTTMPALIERLGLSRVDFIKIDVEGFEFPILKNSIDTINQMESLVVLEFNSWCQIVYSNTSPREFIAWILDNFEFVFIVKRGGAGESLLERIGKDDSIRLLRQNIMEDGCVTDLMVTNSARRLDPSPQFLMRQLSAAVAARDAAIAECERVTAEREAAIAERNALLASTSWKVTEPLRRLATAFPRTR